MTIQRVIPATPCAMLILAASCGAPAPEAAPEAAAPAAKPEPVNVTHFYATPGAVNAGEEVMVCYGLEGADSVEMKPHVRDLRPGSNRCFSFAPKKSGSYTLTARGQGGEDSAQLEIRVSRVVRPPPKEVSRLTLFRSSDQRVGAGETVTLCYSVEEVTAVTIDPPIAELEPISRCFTTVMEKTTTFELTATGPGDRKESRKLTVVVN